MEWEGRQKTEKQKGIKKLFLIIWFLIQFREVIYDRNMAILKTPNVYYICFFFPANWLISVTHTAVH